MRLNDDVLCRAAALVRDKRMNSLSEYEEYPVHEFSEAFETEMQEIMDKLDKGEIKPYKVSMGWQYYARHGLVAVLVCFLLTCFAAPQLRARDFVVSEEIPVSCILLAIPCFSA